MSTIDMSEVLDFVTDIEGVRENIGPHLRSAFEVSARHIKDDWNEALGPSRPYWRHIGRSVDYDVTVNGRESAFSALGYVSTIEAEIGPNLDRLQGAMAGWEEEGTAARPARHHGAKALKKYEADIENGIALAAVDALLDAGL